MQNFNCEIKKVNMYEAIADKLEEMILSDNMRVDEKLPSEQSLATSFGVSRPVIREALMLLNARGLISQKNGEGAHISRPSGDNIAKTVNLFVQMSKIDISSLFEVRLALEVLSAQLAATQAVEEDFKEFDRLAKEMRAAKNNNREFAKLDAEFHAHIAKIGGNQVLYMLLDALTTQIADMIEHNLLLEGANDDALHYHERIVEALKTGSPEKSADIMRSHIIMSMRNAEAAKKFK